MSAFALKIIAIIAMTLNHIAHGFGDMMPNWLYYICLGAGGMTFPIMAYFMSEGYKYTSNLKKYAMRLFVFALLSFFPFYYTMAHSLNVLFTLLIGLFVLYLYDHMKSRVGFAGCTATIPLLLSYNGEKGRSMKYLFYAYYPAHLAVIGVLIYCIQ